MRGGGKVLENWVRFSIADAEANGFSDDPSNISDAANEWEDTSSGMEGGVLGGIATNDVDLQALWTRPLRDSRGNTITEEQLYQFKLRLREVTAPGYSGVVVTYGICNNQDPGAAGANGVFVAMTWPAGGTDASVRAVRLNSGAWANVDDGSPDGNTRMLISTGTRQGRQIINITAYGQTIAGVNGADVAAAGGCQLGTATNQLHECFSVGKTAGAATTEALEVTADAMIMPPPTGGIAGD